MSATQTMSGEDISKDHLFTTIHHINDTLNQALNELAVLGDQVKELGKPAGDEN